MDHQDEDVYYIKNVLKGDSRAFEKLVNKYKNKAYTLALRIVRSTEDAEEVSQDAFLKAYKALKDFKHNASFSTWFYRIVYNTALTKIKKKRLDTNSIDEYELSIATDDLNGLSNLIVQDKVHYVREAISQLTSEEASLLNLYYTHDKGMDEIALITGLTHGNVRVKITRLRKKMYTLLSRILQHELKSIK